MSTPFDLPSLDDAVETRPTRLNGAVFSSAKHDWRTPAVVLDRVRQIGPIGLDPCGAEGSLVGARITLSLEDGNDGLSADWVQLIGGLEADPRLIFVNSPYGSEVGRWVAKAVREARAGAEIVLLLPARTDARWWQNHVRAAAAVCFWAGRLKFVGAPSSAPFPSALWYFGSRVAAFREAFADAGWIVGAPR